MNKNTKFALILGGSATIFLVAFMSIIFVYQVNKRESKYDKGYNIMKASGANMKGFNKILEQRVRKINKDSGGKVSNKHKQKSNFSPSDFKNRDK
jgi:hypothetical protein